MKLALIRRQFAATGGAELYLQRLIEALAGAGHELHLFTESWGPVPSEVTVHQVHGRRSRATRALRFALAVEAELAKQRFDCVFSLERTLRQDVYRAGDGVHRVWLQRRRQFAPWWRKPFVGLDAFHRHMLQLETRTFDPRNTRHIIANSEMVKREIIEHFQFPASRIHLVRNGVDVARFQRGKRRETRALLGVGDRDFLLLFVGSGGERKGLTFLLSAQRRLEKTRAPGWSHGAGRHGRIAQQAAGRSGKGSDSEPAMCGACAIGHSAAGQVLDAFGANVKLLVVGKVRKPWRCPRSVIFTGPMAEVEDAYAAADLFVSLPIYEPSANVVFEALAAGLPVVTSALNGASELIEDGVNGTVIDNPADTRRVIEAIVCWWRRWPRTVSVPAVQLSLERNLLETLAVLEAARSEART
jgi:UDP-glucose:(heptosyl)LPS alpha-1,3-glucosyltransferase